MVLKGFKRFPYNYFKASYYSLLNIKLFLARGQIKLNHSGVQIFIMDTLKCNFFHF